MIALFTDYGHDGPYLGQVQAVLYRDAPAAKIINLLADAPRNNPRASAYLLAALAVEFPPQTIFFAVVDPGVGSFEDHSVIMKVMDRWFVGPDNGLFDIVARRGGEVESWRINFKPERLSASFHGRDLYAPVCALLANQHPPPGDKLSWQDRHGWPDDLLEVIYIDHFGNAMTGIRAAALPDPATLTLAGRTISRAGTFSDVPPGEAIWYENANGLAEIAVNLGSAAQILGVGIGSAVEVTAG